MSLTNWFERNFGGPVFTGRDELGFDHFTPIDSGQKPKPKPRLAAVRRAPSRDAFAAWRDNPVTQFVFAALNHNVDECREQWMALSWGAGKADQRQLDGLRERADALLGFTADYDAFCETLGLEPEAGDA